MTRRRAFILAALTSCSIAASCGGNVESTRTGTGAHAGSAGTTHAGGSGGTAPSAGGADAGNDAGAAGAPGCSLGMKLCGGACVAVDDPSYGCTPMGCEACVPAPHGTNACVSGLCKIAACDAGWGDCDGSDSTGCETNLSADPSHCGSCAAACAPAQTCATGACTGDSGSGGAAGSGGSDAGNDAGAAGAAGAPSCGSGMKQCNGTCVSLDDPAHGCTLTGCQACSPISTYCCKDTASCAYPEGNPGYADCDHLCANGSETNLVSDVKNCGFCGNLCALPHATSQCVYGLCQIAACDAGWGDCDGISQNGCEANLLTDAKNCAACGYVCSPVPTACPGSACVNGKCGLGNCPSPVADCDGNPANGCETNLSTDPSHCGCCTTACATGQSCVSGTCT